jgi:hypothetical protein
MDYRMSLVAFSALLLLVSCQEGAAPSSEADGETMADMGSMESSEGHGMGQHSDHDPRHGGIFFMALDEVHHLEGTLSSPGMVRVFLYDAMTMPLDSERMAQASGTLHWGEFPDPPAIPLKAGNEVGMLMAELDREIEFPLTLTLLLNFPGAQDGESELFNLIFDEYSQPPAADESEGMSHEEM